MSTATTTPWPVVLAGLRGRRLAIYDDVLRCGAHAVDWVAVSVNHADDMEWLAVHRFLARDAADNWWARPALEAMKEFEAEGAAKVENWKGVKVENRKIAETRPAVQAHQGEWFALDGYREPSAVLS